MFKCKVLNALCKEYTVLFTVENLDRYELKAEFQCLSIPNIQKILSLISSRDNIRFKIRDYEDDDLIISYSSNDDIEEFCKSCKSSINIGDKYILDFLIVKKCCESEVSIYDFDAFVGYLDELDLSNILDKFSKLLQNTHIIFRLQDDNMCFSSESIYFLPEQKEVEHKQNDRVEKLDLRMSICNFMNASKYILLPSDFNFPKTKNILFNKIMCKLKEILSIVSIADISRIEKSNTLFFTINGYKRIDSSINYKDNIDKENYIYYEIQEWLYSSKNLNDKVGIIRNMISISANNGQLFTCDKSLFSSIKSAHEIYLKKNLEKYLEVKGKVTEFLMNLNEDTSKIIDTLGDTFYSNIKVAVTFYATVVIMNIISDNRLDSIFTEDIILISFVMLAFSLIFMIYTRDKIKKDIERYEQKYFRLKNSYEEILDKDDIESIFRHDLYLKEDKEYIHNKTKTVTKVWSAILLVLFTALIIA